MQTGVTEDLGHRCHRRLLQCELFEGPANHALSGFPTEAGIRYRHSITQLVSGTREWLIALTQITFDHHSDDCSVALDALLNNAFPDLFLPSVLLSGIGMAAIHHKYRWQTPADQLLCSLIEAGRVVVGPGSASSQHDVPYRIAC